MNILIDIGHPAHVHYFRNFIKIFESKGHNFIISSREKECTFELLDNYNIKYFSRGKGGESFIGKIIYLFYANWVIYKLARTFKPDLFLSMASPYAAQVSWLTGKPHFAFDDTEHAVFARKFYKKFSKIIFTPHCFTKNLGPKQIRFDSFMELFYLHPKYFSPSNTIFSDLGVDKQTPYIILRFISWGASHDLGHSGIDLVTKRELVKKLSSNYKVVISSEGDLPEDLEKFRIKFPAYKMHNVLANASLFIGESATMAQECAMLGTPAVYVNTLNAGTLINLERKGLIYSFRGPQSMLKKIDKLLEIKNLTQEHKKRMNRMLKPLVDPNRFLVDYVESHFDIGSSN